MEGVIVGQFGFRLCRPPSRVGTADEVAPVERVSGVKFVACLELLWNAGVEEPFVLALLTLVFDLRVRVEVDRGDEGDATLAVHDDAVVVVLEFVLVPSVVVRNFHGQRSDRAQQFRKRHREAQKVGIVAAAFVVIWVGFDPL